MVFNAATYSGADFSIKVSACLHAAAAAGGGTCDARGFPNTNTASESIVAGDGKHAVNLLLPIGAIVFAPGKHLVYRSYATIQGAGGDSGSYNYYGRSPGSGTIIYCDTSTTTVCVENFNESGNTFGGLVGAHLSDFSIQGAYSDRIPADSVGLMVGGNGSNVGGGRFERLSIAAFDKGTFMDGPGGCTCYNSFHDVNSHGASYGLYTQNSSGYASGVNSNNWYGGTIWGAVGLYLSGDGKNTFWHIDIEGSKKHGMVLAGYGDAIIAPYFEANGSDLLNGRDNMVLGPLSYGGGEWSPDRSSTCTTCFWLGPDAAPFTIGATAGMIFGGHSTYNDGYNSQAALLLKSGGGLELTYAGNQSSVYGRYGHSPLQVGGLEAFSGLRVTGSSSLSSIANPPSPRLAASGGTGTKYTYYVIGYDSSGGRTLPSQPATVSGPPVLGSVLTAAPKAAGTGYAINDLITIDRKKSKGNATALVTSTGAGGGVRELKVNFGGSGYAALSSDGPGSVSDIRREKGVA